LRPNKPRQAKIIIPSVILNLRFVRRTYRLHRHS
jgi:hypothetical protein